jgi:hypothetical protein
MAIEIVDLPIENGDFPVSYVKLPEGNECSLLIPSEVFIIWEGRGGSIRKGVLSSQLY